MRRASWAERAHALAGRPWDRLSALRRRRALRNAATLFLAVLGPVLAVATYAVMGPLGRQTASRELRLIFLADLIYILLLIGLVGARMAAILLSRRTAAGSRLHMRLVGAFTALALVPTVLVALFAGLTVNIGLEGWFSDRVQQVVSTSLAAAEEDATIMTAVPSRTVISAP